MEECRGVTQELVETEAEARVWVQAASEGVEREARMMEEMAVVREELERVELRGREVESLLADVREEHGRDLRVWEERAREWEERARAEREQAVRELQGVREGESEREMEWEREREEERKMVEELEKQVDDEKEGRASAIARAEGLLEDLKRMEEALVVERAAVDELKKAVKACEGQELERKGEDKALTLVEGQLEKVLAAVSMAMGRGGLMEAALLREREAGLQCQRNRHEEEARCQVAVAAGYDKCSSSNGSSSICCSCSCSSNSSNSSSRQQ